MNSTVVLFDDEIGTSCSNSKEVGDKRSEVSWRPRQLVFSPYAPSDGASAKTRSLSLFVKRPRSGGGAGLRRRQFHDQIGFRKEALIESLGVYFAS